MKSVAILAAFLLAYLALPALASNPSVSLVARSEHKASVVSDESNISLSLTNLSDVPITVYERLEEFGLDVKIHISDESGNTPELTNIGREIVLGENRLVDDFYSVVLTKDKHISEEIQLRKYYNLIPGHEYYVFFTLDVGLSSTNIIIKSNTINIHIK